MTTDEIDDAYDQQLRETAEKLANLLVDIQGYDCAHMVGEPYREDARAQELERRRFMATMLGFSAVAYLKGEA